MDYSYSYSYSGDPTAGAAMAGISLVVGVISAVIGIVLCLLMIVAWWKIFDKAGVEPWKCLIPIYNIVILFEIVGMKPWLVIFIFIPCVNIVGVVFLAMCIFKLVRCFGGSSGMGVAALFFAPIVLPIIAFSRKYQYEGIV